VNRERLRGGKALSNQNEYGPQRGANARSPASEESTFQGSITMTYDSTQAAGSPADHSITAQLAQTGQQRIAALIDLQREFLEAFEEMNRDWLARAQSEASLACELVSKLGSTNPVAAYQDWIKRHGEMLTQDARRLITGGERIAGAYARFFVNGAANGKAQAST
jgi:hypothetical protein